MDSILLENPTPDFAELAGVVKGQHKPRHVHAVELVVDEEILRAVANQYADEPWIPLTAESSDRYYRQLVTLWCRLGYDSITLTQWPDRWLNHPPVDQHLAGDTAELSRGQRSWVNEIRGLIRTREDFDRYPWDAIQPNYAPFETVARHLPEGMKMAVGTNLFAYMLKWLLAAEGMSYLLYDDPEMVGEIFSRWGRKVLDFYTSLVDWEEVGGIFHADDMGFKTSTLISPKHLRQYVFPWLRKYAALAHQHGKPFWLHSCGNHYAPGTIEDLIADVQIDALHAFQDTVLPVTEFKASYGQRVGALGGVDLDKLVRLGEPSLRAYIRDILNQCMPGGRFALGSGNSIANYVPLSNYAILLQEGRRWPG